MSKNIIKINASIQQGLIHYIDNWQEKLSEFKKANEGKNIELTFEVADSPLYYQHKYYRGFLLPDIAFASGEKDLAAVHIGLKRDFLFEPVESNNIEDISEKYFKHGIYLISESDLNTLENIHCRYIKGIICVVDHNKKLIGYIPSTATLLFEEMKKYIYDCEHRLFVDLQGRIGEEGRDQYQAERARDLAMIESIKKKVTREQN